MENKKTFGSSQTYFTKIFKRLVEIFITRIKLHLKNKERMKKNGPCDIKMSLKNKIQIYK